ncbi:hypothetical protein ACTGYS_12835, partial [Streptococcus suis]
AEKYARQQAAEADLIERQRKAEAELYETQREAEAQKARAEAARKLKKRVQKLPSMLRSKKRQVLRPKDVPKQKPSV